MKYARATVRAAALGALTGAIYALAVVSGGRRLLFRRWARATAAILGMRITVRGPIPEPPFVLVSNHLSYLDVVIFAALLDCVFVAKREVAAWPVVGRLCRRVNTIFVNREQRRDVARVNALVERALAARRGVVLFAEGTSTSGARVLPFKASLLEPAARTGRPVAYATISYRTPADQPPAHLSICWWGEMTFLDHLFALFQIPEFDATVVFGPQPIRAVDRKQLAAELWRAVGEQLERTTGGTGHKAV